VDSAEADCGLCSCRPGLDCSKQTKESVEVVCGFCRGRLPIVQRLSVGCVMACCGLCRSRLGIVQRQAVDCGETDRVLFSGRVWIVQQQLWIV
jgi:hypothetical protein